MKRQRIAECKLTRKLVRELELVHDMESKLELIADYERDMDMVSFEVFGCAHIAWPDIKELSVALGERVISKEIPTDIDMGVYKESTLISKTGNRYTKVELAQAIAEQLSDMGYDSLTYSKVVGNILRNSFIVERQAGGEIGVKMVSNRMMEFFSSYRLVRDDIAAMVAKVERVL